MKLTIDINEDRILELAKTASMDELPSSIFFEAKREAVGIAVKEIKDKLVEKSYFSNKESLYSEVSNLVYKEIEAKIKELIEQKFNEKDIDDIVKRHADLTITSWLEKKIYTRLEEIKKDIYIASYGELENERREEREAHEAGL